MNGTNNSSLICIDASVVLRLQLGGKHHHTVEKRWEEWIRNDVTLISPPLFYYEVTNGIWRNVFLKELTVEKGEQFLLNALGLGVHIETTDHLEDLHNRAWEFAQEFKLPAAYDAHYLALAEDHHCEFWTADERLYKRVGETLDWVKCIGN